MQVYPSIDDMEKHVRWFAARSKARRDRKLALRRVRNRDIAKAINRFDRIGRQADARGVSWASRHRGVLLSLCGRRFRETIRAGEDRPRFAERARRISVALFLSIDLPPYSEESRCPST